MRSKKSHSIRLLMKFINNLRFRMPCFRMSGDTFFIWHELIPGGQTYLERLASDLRGLCDQEAHVDVKIHCKNGAKVFAHKIVFASKLLQDFFQLSTCSSCISTTADIVCTDFSISTKALVLKSVTMGGGQSVQNSVTSFVDDP